jgi:endonuclease/exonuclease/phosphatase (EEP) superfamily protein YafD
VNETAGPAAAPPAASSEASPPRRRKVRGWLQCEMGLALGIAGLLASRLGQLWIAFDVFSQFTLQFAVVTVAFLVGLVVPRAKVLVAFVLILVGLVGIGLWPQLASSNPRVLDSLRPGEVALKVVSFNSWYDSQTPDLVRAELERLDADVVTLVEIGPHGRAALLAALRGRYPHQAICFDIAYCNLAVLSKTPIAASEARVGWEGPPVIVAKLGPEAGGLTVFGVHTIRFPHSRAQFRQIVALVALIATTPGRKLVMGDFNATPFSRMTQTVASQTGLVRLTSLPSWPSRLNLPQVAIDHIFASPELRPLETERLGEPAGSDHYPVSIKLAVPVP